MRETPATCSATAAHYRDKERTSLGSQDLFEAAMIGDARRVKFALQALADPNAAAEPVCLRALHFCAAQGHTKAAQVLVEHKADVSSCENTVGLSPLSTACLGGHRELVKLLICSYAKVDGPEGDGGGPLLSASFKNFAEVCELLIAAGCDVNAQRKRSESCEKILEALQCRERAARGGSGGGVAGGLHWESNLRGPRRISVELLHVEGISALHMAAAHGSTRLCEGLFDAGARVGVTDVLLRTPLMLAAERGHVEVTALLLEQGACVGQDAEYHSAGSLAARAGHVAVVQLLLTTRALEVNNSAMKAGSTTMLHHAVFHGQGGCVSLLCELDANVSAALQPGRVRPLMLAASRGHGDIVRELLAYAAGINDMDDDGKTAWVHAMMAGQSAVCRMLANSGAVERVCEKVMPSTQYRDGHFGAGTGGGRSMGTGDAARWQDWQAPGGFGGSDARDSRAIEGALPDPTMTAIGAQPRQQRLPAQACVPRAAVSTAVMQPGGIPPTSTVIPGYALSPFGAQRRPGL